MEGQDKYQDLILENDTKKNKQKQVIFRVIIFVIIFLIVAIAYKLFVGPSDNSRPSLPPQELNVAFESKNDENEVFENIKSDNEGFSDDFGSLEERLRKENNIVEEKPKKSQETENIVKELAKAEVKAPVEKVEEKKVEPSKKQEQGEKEVEKPASPVKKVEPKKETSTKPKKQNESSIFDTIDAKKPAVNKPAVSSSGGSYIQVYASKNIDMKSHEIKKLDKLGLQYKVVTDNAGMSRVIIGPYSQEDRADALKFIRDNVKKDAFYYRAK